MGLDLFLLIYTEHVYISSYMYIDIYVCISHLHRQTQLYICMHLYFYPRLCYTYAAVIHKQPLLWLLISALSLQLLCLDLGKRTDLAEKITLYNWENKRGGGGGFIYLFVCFRYINYFCYWGRFCSRFYNAVPQSTGSFMC